MHTHTHTLTEAHINNKHTQCNKTHNRVAMYMCAHTHTHSLTEAHINNKHTQCNKTHKRVAMHTCAHAYTICDRICEKGTRFQFCNFDES